MPRVSGGAHLITVHVTVLGVNKVWRVYHRGELDTVWFFTVLGL